MPVVLFSIDGTDNTSGAFQKATSSIGNLSSAYDKASGQSSAFDRAQAALVTSASRVESAQIRVQAATLRAALSMQQATSAADRYGSTIAQVATAGLSAETAQIRLSSAFDASVAAQTRASTSALGVQDAYNKLAVAQDLAARNEQKVRDAMNAPVKTPTGGGSGGSSSNLGGAVKNVLLYGLAYQAASDLMSQVEQGFTRALATSRTLSMTGATTGISPATQAALGGYVNNLAGSNTQPFTSDILATGLYAIPSAGVTNKKAIEAINKQSTQFSSFSGSPDTVTDNNALIQTMSAYGVAQNQMAVQAKKFQDVITSMVNLGIVQPADVAASVTTFGARAAQAQVPFNVAGGLFAASTYTTRSSQQSAQDEDAFIRSIIAPNRTQRNAASILGVSNLLGQQGSALLGSDPRAYFQEAFQATKLNPGLDLTKLFGTSNAGAFAMGLIGSGGSNLNRTFGAIGATSQENTTQKAFNAYEKSPAAQFDNSVAAFKTAEQNFSQAAMPLATALTNFATSHVLDPLNRLLQHPSQPATGTPGGISYSAGGSVLHVSPTSGEGSRSPWGLLVDQVKWVADNAPKVASMVGSMFGGGSATTTPTTGLEPWQRATGTLPSAFTGARPPTIVDSYRAPAPASTAGLPYASINPMLVGSAAGGTTGITYGGAAAQARLDALYGPNAISSAAKAPPGTATGQVGGSLQYAYNNLGTAPTAAALAKTNTDALNRTMRDLQNTISIQQLGGNAGGTATAQAALLAFETKNAKALKLDPSDIALLAAQNAAALMATNPTTNLHPFYQKQAGLGSFEAGAGSTLVRAGGVNPSVEAIRALERTIDALRAENSGLLREIARNTGMRAASTAANPNHGGMH